jgi:prepilin signal peptidase PulO-like enzyme (type II secretory pathway)
MTTCDCTWPATLGYVEPLRKYQFSFYIAVSLVMELWTVLLVVYFYYGT